MFEWFSELSPMVQAGIAGIFTWLMTGLGASIVFFFKTVNNKVLNTMQGFAAGVMIAASFCGHCYHQQSALAKTMV